MADRSFQEGGNHYSQYSIQPWDIWEAYPDMDPFTANVIKYMLRWRAHKDPMLSLKKAYHTLGKLIEIEESKTAKPDSKTQPLDHLTGPYVWTGDKPPAPGWRRN